MGADEGAKKNKGKSEVTFEQIEKVLYLFIPPSEVDRMTISQVITAYVGYWEAREREIESAKILTWESTRWLGLITWNAGMKKPIRNIQKLIRFPWEKVKKIKPINPDVEFPDTLK